MHHALTSFDSELTPSFVVLNARADPTFFPDRSAKIYFRPPPSDAAKEQSTQLVDPTYASTNDEQEQKAQATGNSSKKDKAKDAVKKAAQKVAPSSVTDIEVGVMGIVHPEVLGHFEMDVFAASALEFNLEPFL